jgi:hypothetical protein
MQKLSPPWRARRLKHSYVIEDRTGTVVCFIYFRTDAAEARAANVLERELARRVAVNIAKLPELLQSARSGEELEP